jgi:NTE family protein
MAASSSPAGPAPPGPRPPSPDVPLAPAPTDATRPRGGRVIGSGGLKCVAALGLWRVLERERIPVDVAVGCSGGSIYAAAIALGHDRQLSEERTLHMWNDLFTRLHVRSVLRALAPGLLGFGDRLGLVDDRRVWRAMDSAYGERTFADTRIPLHVAATDWQTGEKVVLTEGRVADAVRASIALPLLLRAWPVNGRLLVDGGASNPLPIDVAILEGCDVIIAMGFENYVRPRVDSLRAAIGRATTIASNHLLKATFAFYNLAHHAELIPVLPAFGRPVAFGDTHLIPELITLGERAAEEQLPYLLRLLDAGRAALPGGTA